MASRRGGGPGPHEGPGRSRREAHDVWTAHQKYNCSAAAQRRTPTRRAAQRPRETRCRRSREDGELAPRLQVTVDLVLLLEPVDALVILLWNLESSRAARLGLAVVVEGLARVGREAEKTYLRPSVLISDNQSSSTTISHHQRPRCSSTTISPHQQLISAHQRRFLAHSRKDACRRPTSLIRKDVSEVHEPN